MTEEELKNKIDKIIAEKDDDEMAHISEDILHLEVIKAFCPQWVAKEIERLSAVDFARWCA